MMGRRRFVGALAALGAVATRAQVPGRRYRVGYIGFTINGDDSPESRRNWDGLVERLRELGLRDGENLVLEKRFFEGRPERYTAIARELVDSGFDLAIASSGAAARAVMDASRGRMPVVILFVSDPVRAGLVQSLAHPGGPVTGISNLADELTPKRIELLKAAMPGAARVAFARCPDCEQAAGRPAAEVADRFDGEAAAARRVGVTLLPLEVNTVADFDAARKRLRNDRPDALLIGATQTNVALRDEWITLIDALRLPTMAPYAAFGAMLSYGPDVAAIFRKAADYVARILNGARPGDLPMEQPTELEFVIDERIARRIGIDIPRSVLLRATRVLQ
ncbi:MAG TPA: ABC transporter substrate-binding protein [Caldimonas sp.]|nr:ABC transporter substrate-binding protein [Caldimonas sp.]